jgi:hypothetical protein
MLQDVSAITRTFGLPQYGQIRLQPIMVPVSHLRYHRLLTDDNPATHRNVRKALARGLVNLRGLARFSAGQFGERAGGLLQPGFDIKSAMRGPQGMELARCGSA